MKIKLLPLTILTCTLFLGGKAFDLVGVSHAETATPSADKAADAPADKPANDAKTSATAPAATDDKKDAAATDGANDAKADDAKADDKTEAKDGGKDKDGKDAKPKLPANVSYDRPVENIPQFTDSEKQVLQKLADRRAELDAYAKDLDMKASLVDASSKKLDDKLAELQKLKTDTEVLLKTYNDHEDTKIRSLVKIYENMKPSAAAGIFEQMDMDTMLEIVDKMSEKKASAVLAVMDPKKAKEITQKLADEKTLTKPDAAIAMTAPAKPAADQPPTSITPPNPAPPSVVSQTPTAPVPTPTANPAGPLEKNAKTETPATPAAPAAQPKA